VHAVKGWSTANMYRIKASFTVAAFLHTLQSIVDCMQLLEWSLQLTANHFHIHVVHHAEESLCAFLRCACFAN
jgi:hypothetical protein